MRKIKAKYSEFCKLPRLEHFLWGALLCALTWALAPVIYDFYLKKTITKDQIVEKFDLITSRYGIEVVNEITDDFFSPITDSILPIGPHRDSKISPMQRRVIMRYPQLMQRAFSKYPEGVIKRYLARLHFAGEINNNGFFYGGAYDPFRKIIYLVDNGRQKTDHGIYTFHHEFSSLLMKSHGMFLNPWFENNPNDFVYLYDTEKSNVEIYKNTSLKGTDIDYKKGFMNTYGQTNFENDFNEYSAMIFTYPEKFKRIMDRHPRVRGKFSVWLKFYQEVDPIFTEEYLFGRE